MGDLQDLGEFISTDVLIIGGGIGGVVAAIEARGHQVDVLIVDKATVGWAGQAPKAGNGFWVMAPDDDLNRFVEYHVKEIGDYLNDQELLYSFAGETYGAVERVAEWGVKVTKDNTGKLGTFKHPVSPWSQTGVDIAIMLPLRAKARKMGAKIVNKVQVVDLLTQGERVIGAVGFNLIDNRFYIFRAKATIVATAACGFNAVRMFNGCGDGAAAAYRAGAEMRNAEFANFYDIIRKDSGSAVYGAHDYIYNSAGENISKRYETKVVPDISLALRLGMEKEVSEGRGPLRADVGAVEKTYKIVAPKEGEIDGKVRLFPKKLDMMHRSKAKELEHGASPSPMPEVTLGLQAGTSPIRVDHEMRTSLTGLWAIGAVSYLGSGWSGAVPAPGMMRGSGLMYALLSALRGGPSAARFAIQASLPDVSYTEVNRLREDVFAPLRREKGLLPHDAISAIQDVVCPVKYNLRRSKDRLEEALSRIEELRQRLPELCAKDGHYLGKCHESRSMALCAEMTFRTALMRTESRGSHFREDFPARDDRNWLKWIVRRQGTEGMVLTTEQRPIERYRVQP